MLERARHVRALWNWLPAFRAVAETEHIHEASRLLRVSPSALSRAIRLLEDQVAEPLFDRVGRRLRLNAAGEELLAVVRDSIRRVDDGLSRLGSGEMVGPVFLMSASELVDAYLLPALRQLRHLHAELIPHIHRFPVEETLRRILAGQLDVGFFQEPVVHRRLTVEQLGSVGRGIYCGAGHTLFGSTSVTLTEIVEYPFAVIVSPGTETACDGWPCSQARRVGMCVSDLTLAYEACRSGEMLTILPDVLAQSPGWREGVYRLTGDMIAGTPMYSVRRPTLSKRSRAEAVISAVRNEIAKPNAVPISDVGPFKGFAATLACNQGSPEA